MRVHFISFKHLGEITIYGEGFGLKGNAELDYSLNIFDRHQNARVVANVLYKSEKNDSSYFQGHGSCDLTAGSATCVMWFKGFGEYDGKIMELSLNEVDVNESNYTQNRTADSPNVYALEGKIIDEPKD